LRGLGHVVFTPTLSGLGEKAHLGNHGITLETHVRDIMGTIEAEELNDVVLCGHSYGGMVISGVADRMPERIASLVYLDAFVPRHGTSLNDLLHESLPPEVANMFVNSFYESAREGGSGMMKPIPAHLFNIAEANRAWVDRRVVPQALATFEMPLLLTGGLDRVKRRTYILADGWDPSPYRHFAKRCAEQPGWEVTKVASSHDVMVDAPNELADLLVKAS
jgi:pimeloyl-ACP methyl ester carboxylesterase